MQTDRPGTLETIRLVETEITRMLTSAQAGADAALDAARHQVADRLAQAEQDGRAAGEEAHAVAIATARTQAVALLSAARDRAGVVQAIPPAELDTAVDRLVALVCGRSGGRDEA